VKTFVIGDIHGCCDELLELLKAIDINLEEDKLILLGDYIDRGDKSLETVQLLQELRRKCNKDKLILLKGNHEQMAIDYYEQGNERWFRNGAEATQKSFEMYGETVEDYLEFFKELSSYHEDEHFIYVHAGIKPRVSLAEQSARDLEWIREEFYLDAHASDKTVVFGHTPTRGIDGGDYPVKLNGNIALDTACVYGGSLSAIELVDGELVKVYQVKSRHDIKDED
jgi:serine/threonine protein phosphatase 1